VGNLSGMLGQGAPSILEGVFARLMYRSLYKMHQQALHGTSKMALDTLANMITRRTRAAHQAALIDKSGLREQQSNSREW